MSDIQMVGVFLLSIAGFAFYFIKLIDLSYYLEDKINNTNKWDYDTILSYLLFIHLVVGGILLVVFG